VNAFAQGALQQFTQCLWIEQQTFQLRGERTTMGVSRNFPEAGKVDILLITFRLQMDVSQNALPFLRYKEILHVPAAITKNALRWQQ